MLARSWLVILTSVVMAEMEQPASAGPRKVVVTGAGGQTGQLLFRKLLAHPEEFDPVGFDRTPESKAALVESGIPSSNVAVVDVTHQDAVARAVKDAGKISALCICTSAKPKPLPDGQTDPETGRPVFGFPDGDPEVVDWLGQKYQIDACPPGTHAVLCSTMGGTDGDNRLNAFGRVTHPDGTTTGGNIVKWKRKAEVYLVDKAKAGGLTYTIVHPGGLSNDPGGERELVVGVDDDHSGTESRSIPREDVAEVMLQAVRHSTRAAYRNRSFDVRAKPAGEGTVTTDFESLLDSLNGRDCDYSLGETM